MRPAAILRSNNDARVRQNAHFASDVTASALIGTGIGRAVVRINRQQRLKVSLAPLLAPQARGLALRIAF